MFAKETVKSQACYAKGEYRRSETGTILNELGKPAKDRDIILRASNGFPVVRFCDLNSQAESDGRKQAGF
jgi:hypothetical protein